MRSAKNRFRCTGPTRPDDTITAVSSPPGRSLRGLVRLSGPDVMDILGQLLSPPRTDVHRLAAWPSPRHLVRCRLRFAHGPKGAVEADDPLLLPALVTMFMAPGSYSGQDMAEIQVPGNPEILDRLLHRVVELGARLAEPGEFTFRAFLAGKLDLTQAEGVAATIAAVSDAQLQAATLLRQGQLGRWTTLLASDLAHQLALVEAGIDFVDQDDVVSVAPAQLDSSLERLLERLDHLLSHSRAWRSIESLPRVVLAGPPNSGKSTLFNAILGQRRAIVSSSAHTTRDLLTEPLSLEDVSGNRIEVMLVDVAGLDKPLNALDRQSQAAAREAIEQADLILRTSDGYSEVSDIACGVPTIRVRTKADLSDPRENAPVEIQPFDVAVSSVTGQGLDSLRARMAYRLRDCHTSISGQTLVLQPRHEEALRQTHHHLDTARRLLIAQRSSPCLEQAELIAATLRQALDELAVLAGRMSPEDVLGRVFATFCIGK